MNESLHRVVIVGGGFGGIHAAKALRKAPVDITVLDRRNFHLFQPLLYQVATGALSPGNITSPIRRCIRRNRNTTVLLDEVVGIDPENKLVKLNDRGIAYDTLILAAGLGNYYHGHDWEQWAPGLKTIEDATHIRGRVLYAFEAAEREPEPEAQVSWLTFVVVGAGETGVELAGALGELANDTLKDDFRRINPRDAKILLIEGQDQVLPAYPGKLGIAARRSLERLGVTVYLSSSVKDISADRVTVERADGTEETIRTHCIVWAAGIQASPLARTVAEATGAQSDGLGRLMVQPDLTIPGYPDIIVLGDIANFSHQPGGPLPGVAPVAMQQGRYAGRLINARLAGKTADPFRYHDKGHMATIGRRAAVANFGRLQFSGLPAWLMWLGIHLAFLIEFEHRVLVLVQWAWNYFTRNRGARLIAPPINGAKR
jgi:NADH dehydrogenase